MNFPIQHPMKEARSGSAEEGVVFCGAISLNSEQVQYLYKYLSGLGMLLILTVPYIGKDEWTELSNGLGMK